MRTAAEGIARGAGTLMPAPQFVVKGVSKQSILRPVYGLPAPGGRGRCNPELPLRHSVGESPQYQPARGRKGACK